MSNQARFETPGGNKEYHHFREDRSHKYAPVREATDFEVDLSILLASVALTCSDDTSDHTRYWEIINGDRNKTTRRYIKRLGAEDRSEGFVSTYIFGKEHRVGESLQYARYFALVESGLGKVAVAQTHYYNGFDNDEAFKDMTFDDDESGIRKFDLDYLYDELIRFDDLMEA